MIALAVVHLIFGLAILVFETLRIRNRGGYDFLSFILVVFAVFYGLAPAAFHLANATGYDYSWTEYAKYAYRLYPLSFLLVLASYLCLRAGWRLAGMLFSESAPLPGGHVCDEHERRLTGRLIVTAWLLLFGSFTAYYLYSMAYGGFVGLAVVSNALRAGWSEVANPWSFLKRFGGLTIVASYLFLAVARGAHDGARKHLSVAGLALASVFSLYVLLTWQGRLTLAFYILTLVLADSVYRRRHIRATTLVLPVALIALLLFAGNDLLYMFRRAAATGYTSALTQKPALESAHDFVLGELSFPIVSMNTALSAVYNGATPLRYFIDIPLGVLGLIPQRWHMIVVETASTVNTNLINPSLPGTIPTDLISFGVYSLGACGPPVVAFALGAFARATQDYITRIRPAGLSVVLFFAYGLTIARAVAYADPTQILEGSFYLLLGTAIALAALKTCLGGGRG